MIRYISDWHYDHENVLAFDDRPFTTVAQMNAALIDRWNSAVQPDDITYVLGDMFWCNQERGADVLSELNGRKVPIIGNHDRYGHPDFAARFEQILLYAEIKDGERSVVLCHYPIPCFKNHYHGWYHLYGHVHSGFEASMMEHDKLLMRELYGIPCSMFNVGAMMPYMDYTPRTLDEIISNSDKNT